MGLRANHRHSAHKISLLHSGVACSLPSPAAAAPPLPPLRAGGFCRERDRPPKVLVLFVARSIAQFLLLFAKEGPKVTFVDLEFPLAPHRAHSG
jgi:hypothetical protein